MSSDEEREKGYFEMDYAFPSDISEEPMFAPTKPQHRLVLHDGVAVCPLFLGAVRTFLTSPSRRPLLALHTHHNSVVNPWVFRECLFSSVQTTAAQSPKRDEK